MLIYRNYKTAEWGYIGSSLREWRKGEKLNQKDIAAQLGLERRIISRVEQNTGNPPADEKTRKFLQKFLEEKGYEAFPSFDEWSSTSRELSAA